MKTTRNLWLSVMLMALACQKSEDPTLVNGPDTEYNQIFTFNEGIVAGSSVKSIALDAKRRLWLYNDCYGGTANADRSASASSIYPLKNALVLENNGKFTILNKSVNGKIVTFFDPSITTNYIQIKDGFMINDQVKIVIHELNPTQRVLKQSVVTLSTDAVSVKSTEVLKLNITIPYGESITTYNGEYFIYGQENKGTEVRTYLAKFNPTAMADLSAWTFWNGSSFVSDATKAVFITNTLPKQFCIGQQNGKLLSLFLKGTQVFAREMSSPEKWIDTPATAIHTVSESANVSHTWLHENPFKKETAALISYDLTNAGSLNATLYKSVDNYRPKFIRHIF